ncbi:MAG: AMP-binding protein [Burkholderiaceae bacterium]
MPAPTDAAGAALAEAPAVPLGELIRDRAAGDGDAELLSFVDHDGPGEMRVVHRGYASLWAHGQSIATALSERGLRRGDRFALLMRNHPEFVDAMVASSILGTVFVPIDPRTRGKKLQFMLESAGCKGVIAADYCAESLREVIGQTRGVEWVLLVGERGDEPVAMPPARVEWLADVVRPGGAPLPVRGDELDMPMQMLFTSGTTGDPKAIVGSYRRYAAVGDMLRTFGVLSSDRMYTGLSLTHANALAITLGGALYNGVRTVISRRFSKRQLWRVIGEFRCTTMNLLGGMFSAIHSEPPTPQEADNPLRLVVGAGMPKNMWAEFSARFGVQVLEFYGAAEGGLLVNRPGEGPIGSIGRPPPNLIAHVVDDDDEPCAPFVPGEIAFENADGTPFVVTYHGNPEASADKTRGGWLRMGDIGYRDEQGWFYFMHRRGNEIRRNGDFISPGFIEKELAEHPDISDVFVYGVPGRSGTPGEKDVVAAIVTRDPGVRDAASIFALCEARLERNSIPTYLQFVDEIPKTASEKPLERVLRLALSPTAPNVVVRSEDR